MGSLPAKKESKAMRRRRVKLERRIKDFEQSKGHAGYNRPGSGK